MAEVIQLQSRRVMVDGAVVIFPSKETPVPKVPEDAMDVCREIRRRFSQCRALVDHELALENEPGHSAAKIVARLAEQQLERFCDQVLKRPITCWDDVIIRAEVLRASSQYSLDGLPCWCSPNEGNSREEALAGELMAAVVHLGGVGRLGLDD